MKTLYAAAGAAVAIFVALLAASSYANASLQYRSQGAQGFNFSDSTTDVAMDVCNPTPFPAGFDRLAFVAFYGDSQFAEMEFREAEIAASSQARVDGMLDVDGRAALAAVFQRFADSLNGEEVEGDDIRVRMTSESRLLGFVPSSQSTEMSAGEFSDMMNGKNGFDCGE
ncbi:hypothetical protein [Candidatus Nitrososphaera sp. FF02]|uniref:hypothetical protein n=1 Tax=Candidatus Nitrososphaera sp. FF02 TaxID=3398226 RepID=UPI0039ED6B60